MPSGDLGFTLVLWCAGFACMSIVLLVRRFQGGELGGSQVMQRVLLGWSVVSVARLGRHRVLGVRAASLAMQRICFWAGLLCKCRKWRAAARLHDAGGVEADGLSVWGACGIGAGGVCVCGAYRVGAGGLSVWGACGMSGACWLGGGPWRMGGGAVPAAALILRRPPRPLCGTTRHGQSSASEALLCYFWASGVPLLTQPRRPAAQALCCTTAWAPWPSCLLLHAHCCRCHGRPHLFGCAAHSQRAAAKKAPLAAPARPTAWFSGSMRTDPSASSSCCSLVCRPVAV